MAISAKKPFSSSDASSRVHCPLTDLNEKALARFLLLLDFLKALRMLSRFCFNTSLQCTSAKVTPFSKRASCSSFEYLGALKDDSSSLEKRGEVMRVGEGAVRADTVSHSGLEVMVVVGS